MPDCIGVCHEGIATRERPGELDLQVLVGLANANAIVFDEALEQLDALLEIATLTLEAWVVLCGGESAAKRTRELIRESRDLLNRM
jgi:hypothetical protein